MPLKLPKNQIVESKYTSGKEFMFVNTQKEHQGYYYETQGKFYAGKEFAANNPEIIKIKSDKFNNLLGSASTFIYGVLSGVKLSNPKISSLPQQDQDPLDSSSLQSKDTYYAKKINSNIIKQINQETYTQLQSNSLYTSVIIKADYSNIDEANKKLPGVKDFILG